MSEPQRPRTLFPVLLTLLFVAGCGDSEAPRQQAAASDAPRNSIVEVAQSAGQFSALLRAVEHAGLTETLRENGPFTVFAPTDGAFANLPDGTMEALEEDTDALSGILLYHVVSGEYTLEELRGMSSLETVQGSTLEITDSPQGLQVGGTSILTANVRASNGIVHVITSVLVP